MPSRWPRPQVSRASIAWTPVASGSRIRGRSTRRRRLAVERHAAEQHRLRPAVDRSGRGRRSRGPAIRRRSAACAWCVRADAVAAAHAGRGGEQVDEGRAVAEADHFARGRRARLALDARPAPTGAGKSATVAVMPTVSTTLPASDVVITSSSWWRMSVTVSRSRFHAAVSRFERRSMRRKRRG